MSLVTGAYLSFDMAQYDNYTVLEGPQGQPPGEYIPVTGNDRVVYSYYTFELPLLFKVNFKPTPFVLSPYGGVYFHTSFGQSWDGELENDLPLGYRVGFTAGRKTGRGIMFLDLHWSADLEKTRIIETNKAKVNYFRNMITLSVGYEFGFLDHKIKPKPPEEPKTN
jgi:hypothetical protein